MDLVLRHTSRIEGKETMLRITPASWASQSCCSQQRSRGPLLGFHSGRNRLPTLGVLRNPFRGLDARGDVPVVVMSWLLATSREQRSQGRCRKERRWPIQRWQRHCSLGCSCFECLSRCRHTMRTNRCIAKVDHAISLMQSSASRNPRVTHPKQMAPAMANATMTSLTHMFL